MSQLRLANCALRAYHEAGHKAIAKAFGIGGTTELWYEGSDLCGNFHLDAIVADPQRASHAIPDSFESLHALIGMAGMLAEIILQAKDDGYEIEGAAAVEWMMESYIGIGMASENDLATMGCPEYGDDYDWPYDAGSICCSILRDDWQSVVREAERLISEAAR